MASLGFKFLPEKPLQTAEELSGSKFGHEEIADTLIKVIRECPAPFTVGLFAKWGSGKSTVANSLKDKLPKENIPVVLFDVWKHEGDALRRTFLKEMVRQLKEAGSAYFDKDFVINERIEQSVSRSSVSKIKFRTEAFMQLGWYIIAVLFLIGVGAYIADYLNKFELFLQFLASITGFTSGGALLLWLVKHSVDLFTKETVSYGIDRFADPHEFEREFGRVLRSLKHPRILIIFDNLDRVMHDKVAEVLSTIKTFLEPQDIANSEREVVFLVPCDAKAIKQHLSSLYNHADKQSNNNHAFDPDEFLRKFFNTIIWIPDFIPSELESFARTCLKETKVALLDNDYVAWIITKAFRNNPRQVIQFTNILLANYLLVEEREGADKDFPDGFLKENVPQLTKYLILNQLFPEEMDALREKKVLDLNDFNEEALNTQSKKQFLTFVKETKAITITDLRTFFTLRRSEQEKKFPGFETFIMYLEDRRVEDAAIYFDQIGEFSMGSDELTDFSQAIKEELESKANPISTINLIHTLFHILLIKKTTLASTLYEEVNIILGGRCREVLHTIPPNILNDAFLVKDAKYRRTVVPQWLVVIEVNGQNEYTDREFDKQVISIFAKQPDYLQFDQVAKIKELLSTSLAQDIEVAKIITQSPQAQAALGSAGFARAYANAIPNGGTMIDVGERMKVLNTFGDDLLRLDQADFWVRKFNDLQVGANQNTKPDTFIEKKNLLDGYREFMSSHTSIFTAAPVATRDAFADSLNAGFNASGDQQARAVFVPTLFDLRKFLSDSKRGETERFLASWVGSVNPISLETTLLEFESEHKSEFFEVQSIYDAAANRAISDESFRAKFFAMLTDTQKQQFIEKILGTNFNQSLDFFENITESKEIKCVFSIFDKVWTKFDNINPPQKQRLFKFVNKHKGNNDAKIRETLGSKILTCLTTTDLALQQVGLSALTEATLSKEIIRKIAKGAFDWVKKPNVDPAYQPHTLSAIVRGFEEFNQEEKNDFIHFLFDEIVRQSVNRSHLIETLILLKELNPKYEERKTNFDDIKARIDEEQNADLKRVLLEGIDGFRPKKTNKDNAEYWSWIQAEKEKIVPVT